MRRDWYFCYYYFHMITVLVSCEARLLSSPEGKEVTIFNRISSFLRLTFVPWNNVAILRPIKTLNYPLLTQLRVQHRPASIKSLSPKSRELGRVRSRASPSPTRGVRTTLLTCLMWRHRLASVTSHGFREGAELFKLSRGARESWLILRGEPREDKRCFSLAEDNFSGLVRGGTGERRREALAGASQEVSSENPLVIYSYLAIYICM